MYSNDLKEEGIDPRKLRSILSIAYSTLVTSSAKYMPYLKSNLPFLLSIIHISEDLSTKQDNPPSPTLHLYSGGSTQATMIVQMTTQYGVKNEVGEIEINGATPRR